MAVSSVSYTKTPQAGDDSYWYTEDELLADCDYDSSSNTLTLDVMSNDLGGNAKKLYSIDDGDNALADLLTRDVSTDWEATLGGNWIRINAGKIEFKFAEALDSLAEGGEPLQDSFRYAIQLGNGTISYATVSITVVGSNDGPRVSAAVTAGGYEGDADFEVDLLQGASDIDNGETATLQASGLSFSVNGGPSSSALPAGLTLDGNKLLVDADGSAFDHLAAGATEVITVSYVVEDVHGEKVAQTATITVTGSNDAPVAEARVDAATEGGATITGQVVATDVDDGAILSYSLTGAAPAGLTFNADGSYSFDPTVGAYDHLKAGATQDVVVSFKANDGTADSNVQTLTITVTGSNDGPVAVADTAAGTENQLLSIDVLANDTDVDDGHLFTLVSASAPAGKGSVSVVGGQLQFDPGSDFDHLAEGAEEKVIVGYTMTDEHGAESGSMVTITVTGSNDLASITGTASGDVQEATASSAGVPTTGGVLLLSDVDDGEAVFQLPASLDGVYGSFTLDTGSGVWSYQLDNSRAATQALNSGTTVYDTLLVKSYDGTAQQTITVSIQGATDNSAPQFLSSGVVSSIYEHLLLLNEQQKPVGFDSAQLATVLASDADGDALTYSLLSDASGGAFQISAGGAVSVKDLSLLDFESAALIPGGGNARGYALEVAVSDGINAPVTTTRYVEVKNVETSPSTNGPDYIDGGSGNETISGGGQVDVIFGDGGDDTLRGDSGGGVAKADQLFGGAGNDQLFGDADNDMLRGGSGNDALTGGTGSDTFVWSLADISGGPYTDTVKDWGAGGTADKLDLRDLLQGEHANALSLDAYLDFSYAGSNTTIAVHSAGAGTAVTQSIVLEGIQLAGVDDQAIISNLLSSNKLVVDV